MGIKISTSLILVALAIAIIVSGQLPVVLNSLSPDLAITGQGNLGGATNFDSVDTTDGYLVDGTTVIDGSGNYDGAVTSGSASTFASTLTLSGDFIVDTADFYVDVSATSTGVGTSSPLDMLHVENQYATSTVIISSGTGSVGGRIILEDHDGAGCSEIVILDGTIASKTVTCPTGI